MINRSCSELKKAMNHKDLKDVVLIVIINKIDLGPPQLEQIKKEIEYDSLEVRNKRLIEVSDHDMT